MSRLLVALLLALGLCATAAARPTQAPDILLASIYREPLDVGRYLVSEKLDGVRAIWDGEALRFRSGRKIAAPKWFVDALPKQALDGELWLGRERFERLSGIVRQEIPDETAWRDIRFMVFEAPGMDGNFNERAQGIVLMTRQAGVPWLQPVAQFRVASRRDLQEKLDQIVIAGGEGLMLHRADADYQTGRSDILLKFKPRQDAEAEVIGYKRGRGKFADRIGALRMRTPEGRVFMLGVGLTDELRDQPPAQGTWVTYRYLGLTTTGLPRFASFLRLAESF